MPAHFPIEYDFAKFETITVSSASIGFTTTFLQALTGPDKGLICKAVVMRVETNSIRFRLDGTDPTNAVGTLLQAAETLTLRGAGNIARFRAIAVASDAPLSVHYGY